MKDEEFIARMRDAYTAEPVNPTRFDARLAERIETPARRGWIWGIGGGLIAAAAAVVLWMQPPAPAPSVEPPAAVIASAESQTAPSVASPVDAEPAEEWLAALDTEALDDGLDGLPDDYVELADMLEL